MRCTLSSSICAMKLMCSSLILLLTANASHGAAAADSVVRSGDFLVLTTNITTSSTKLGGGPGGSGVRMPPSDYAGEYGFAVVSSTGLLRRSVTFPFDYLPAASAAVSPDLKYVFVSAALLGKKLQMGIVVIKLEGNSPKVIQRVAMPDSKFCRSDTGPIAVVPASRNGKYDLYVARECYNGPLTSERSRVTSFDVVKLGYTLSTGKFKPYSKKPYSRQVTDSYRNFYSLQVINGVPYGLLYSREKFRLLRLGSQKVLASSRYNDCYDLKITSPSEFYGVCNVLNVRRDFPTYALVSVSGDKRTERPIQLSNETYNGGEGLQFLRFTWGALASTSKKPSDVYAVLGDEVNSGNKTLYKLDRMQSGSSPKTVFKFPQSVVSKPASSRGFLSIGSLFIVP